MKKEYLYIVFLSLFIMTSKSMEMNTEEEKNEQMGEISRGLENASAFEVHLPNEIIEKIFEEANHQGAEEIIEQITIALEFINSSGHIEIRRNFDNIDQIVNTSGAQTYTRVGLWILLDNKFTCKEKQHFFSLMINNPRTTSRAKIILEYFSKQALLFRYRSSDQESTTLCDLIHNLLALAEKDETCQIILIFLQRYRGSLPKHHRIQHRPEEQERNNESILGIGSVHGMFVSFVY